MLSCAYAHHLPPADDPVFSASFYAPYQSAAAAALELVRHACAGMPLDVLAIESRIKSGASIRGKLQRKHLPHTAEAAIASLRDIAGLRVVLTTRDAVYRCADLILENRMLMLEDVHDYIAAPKKSGYRSLHLIMRISLSPGAYAVPVEIQLRTAAMDAWACAEHRLIYKPRA